MVEFSLDTLESSKGKMDTLEFSLVIIKSIHNEPCLSPWVSLFGSCEPLLLLMYVVLYILIRKLKFINFQKLINFPSPKVKTDHGSLIEYGVEFRNFEVHK